MSKKVLNFTVLFILLIENVTIYGQVVKDDNASTHSNLIQRPVSRLIQIENENTIAILSSVPSEGLYDYKELDIYVRQHKEIQTIYIRSIMGYAEMGDDFYKYLSTWRNIKALKHDPPTAASDITDINFSYICKLEQLEHIRLVDLKLTRESFKKFGNFKKLKTLSLGKCNISDKNLADISNMENIQNNLQYLHFAGCSRITVKGLRKLQKLKELKELRVEYCKRVSTNDLDALKKTLPGVEIKIVNPYTKEELESFQGGWG